MTGDRPYLDTLTVPSILVMPGDPWPSDFYSRYPEAFRLPVRIVWREDSSGPDATPPRPSPAATVGHPRRDAALADAPGDDERLHAPPASTHTPAPVPDADASAGRSDPVGAFLRINGVLDGLSGTQQPIASSGESGATRRAILE